MADRVLARAVLALVAFYVEIPGRVLAATHHPKSGGFTCLINLASVRSPLRFADFPAMAHFDKHWKGPLLTSTDTLEFGTTLQMATREPPNFAGHYSIAIWGCGSSCTDFAIIDRQSGRVFLDERLRAISGVHVGSEPNEAESTFNLLRFRQDSRLLVLLGAPKEDHSREGVTSLKWTGKNLVQLRFVRQNEACTPQP